MTVFAFKEMFAPNAPLIFVSADKLSGHAAACEWLADQGYTIGIVVTQAVGPRTVYANPVTNSFYYPVTRYGLKKRFALIPLEKDACK